jgi:hypothetical protein
MVTKGESEICEYNGVAWKPIFGSLAHIRYLLADALERLDAACRDSEKKRLTTAVETASVIATMPESTDPDTQRWQDDGGIHS